MSVLQFLVGTVFLFLADILVCFERVGTETKCEIIWDLVDSVMLLLMKAQSMNYIVPSVHPVSGTPIHLTWVDYVVEWVVVEWVVVEWVVVELVLEPLHSGFLAAGSNQFCQLE